MIDISGRHLRNVVVLAVQATKVTARTGQGQTCCTRMEMIKRFLLYGVNGQRTRLAIHLTDKHAILIPPTATYARLALGNTAVVRTERTLHPSVVQTIIIPAFHQNTIAS